MKAILTIAAFLMTLYLFILGISWYFKLVIRGVKKIFSGAKKSIANTLWKLLLTILYILAITILFLLLVAISIAAIVEGGLQFFLGLIGGLILGLFEIVFIAAALILFLFLLGIWLYDMTEKHK